MKRLLVDMILISTILFFLGCATTTTTMLEDYKVASIDEEAIVIQLGTLKKAFNRVDLGALMELYREDAKIMAGRKREVLSKQEYADYIGDRMRVLHVDYIGIPKIAINGDIAYAKVVIGISDALVHHKFTFNRNRDTGKWLIKNSEHHF